MTAEMRNEKMRDKRRRVLAIIVSVILCLSMVLGMAAAGLSAFLH